MFCCWRHNKKSPAKTTPTIVQTVQITTTSLEEKAQWEKPPPGFYKFTVDASFYNDTKVAGLGGIFRNDEGDPQLIFQEKVFEGVSDPTEAEFQAFYIALVVANLYGYQDFVVECDCKGNVRKLKKMRERVISDLKNLTNRAEKYIHYNKRNEKHALILEAIRARMESLVRNNVKFGVSWIDRDANGVANELAREVAKETIPVFKIFDLQLDNNIHGVSTRVCQIIQEDKTLAKTQDKKTFAKTLAC